MKNTLVQTAEKIIRENNGYIRAAEAERKGIPAAILQRMYKANLLVKEARGLYRLADAEPLSNPDLVLVASQTPRAVICLISALHFHDLTTQIPRAVYIALPKGTWRPKLTYPPLRIVSMSAESYAAGITEHTIDGLTVRIYDKEKTIADCFKFRNKIGRRVAIEALKDYLSQPDFVMDKLVHYARVDRVATIMLPYIRALTA